VFADAAGEFAAVETDAMGSTVARVAGTGEGPLLAVVGHIDEIGIVVTHAGDDGLIAIRPLGGYDPHVLLGQRVEVLTREGRLAGVIGPRKVKRKPGEDRRPIGFDDLFLDVGAKDGAEARTLVRPGDTGVIAGDPVELRGNRIAARSLDNRIGSYVALEVARRVAAAGGTPGDVAGLAVVQEEVGDFAGARAAAFELQPAVAIAVDVTWATDQRGGDSEDAGEHSLGGGPALMRGPSMDPGIFELLFETAEQEKIPVSVEVSRGHTNTDADAIYLSRVGVATGVVSIPLRYMHTPVETVDLDDVEAVVQLLVAFAGRLQPEQTFSR
jgi:endoglucanase